MVSHPRGLVLKPDWTMMGPTAMVIACGRDTEEDLSVLSLCGYVVLWDQTSADGLGQAHHHFLWVPARVWR